MRFGALVVILITTLVLLYIFNKGARDWINIHILRKEITEQDVATIELDVDKLQYIYAYDRFICIMTDGKLSLYNSYGGREAELDVQLSNPIYSAANNYLGIAETNGQKVCLVSEGKLLWENKVEGNITKINVARNGTVSVITTGTSYKSVIMTFDKNGKELFKTYRASIIAVDTDISVDGRYLGVAEVNTSGALIESNIEIIDIEKAKNGTADNSAVVYQKKAEANKIITDIKYQEKGQLICIYDDSVHMIYEGEDKTILEFNSNTKIADINLKSYIVRAEEVGRKLL